MYGSPKRSALISGLLHAGAILVILAVTGVHNPIIDKVHEVLLMPSDIGQYHSVAPHKMTGGGGGGGRENPPASKGDAPPFSTHQFVPPVVRIENYTPILPMEPTLIGDSSFQVPKTDFSRWGDPNGVDGPPSAGPGKGHGIGDGNGTGIGPGDGPGLGPGEGGGGVIYNGPSNGGSVTPPVLLWKSDPEYSDEARKAKLQGLVVLRIEVNTRGQAQNIRVEQGLGLGLDDRAIQAVQRWKFRPGLLNGKPAVVAAIVEVSFRLL